ncbi:hypothetical protein RZA67_15440 [Stenotrophomonas sp. C3(2023)]|uniref:hypothetical protein n=1 Tax=Stenotrophomonas sp. C3(2023) TaxID=3080277 RepID=UPI00293C87C2|nr:hypothetical protein [Stenotrophomonas sp. C3(2023)]MDV3470116.1 hypothetical protein [Stenotrophomonas sp. C3(2023)]
MSTVPPQLTAPAAAAATQFVRPLALVSLLASAAVLIGLLVTALLAWVFARTDGWALVAALAAESRWPASLQWMLQHPARTSLWMAAACAPAVVASWGLYRQQRWGLWSFAVLLVLSALANFGITWWLDAVGTQVIDLLHDAQAVAELHLQRQVMTFTLLGTSVLFLGLQGWLAWRLLRPDIRSTMT